MEILNKNVENRGKFYILDNGTEVAKMTYVSAGDTKFIIDHTEVSESYKGQNLGLKLVEAAVNYARTNNLKIIPLCPFARSVFDKRPDFGDVLS